MLAFHEEQFKSVGKRKCLQNHKKHKMFTVSWKYWLWPIIGIVNKWGLQWCNFCGSNLLLTACRQPKHANFAKSQKYKKFTVSKKYGLWLIIGIVMKENRNYVTFVCLTYCWQPVGSLSAQMFAKSHKYKMFTVCRKYGVWPIIGIVMKWGSQ